MKISSLLTVCAIMCLAATMPISAQTPIKAPTSAPKPKPAPGSNGAGIPPQYKKKAKQSSWKSRAESGDPKAMFEYGIRLNDYNERNKWMRKSAEAGYGEAIWDVATTYWNERDYANSALWYKKGADLGDGNCAISYGQALEKGYGVPVDKALALSYYKKGLKNAIYSGVRNIAKEGIPRLEAELAK